MFRRTRIKRFLVAVAATGLLAAGCGGGDTDSQPDAAPTSGAEDAGTTTTTTEGATQPSEATTENVPESELVEPAEQAPVVQSADHEEEAVEGFPEVEPLEQDVICGDDLVLLAEFVTDTDNGCRPEMCDDGRTDHGDCQLPPEDEPMTEEEVAELPTETIPQEEYGLEGCTEVSLGVCDQDGLLFCHDTVEGWTECPGQPTGDPCEHDASDPLTVAGASDTGGTTPEITLASGLYRVDICLSGNDLTTDESSGFRVYLPPVTDANNIVVGGVLLTPGDQSQVGGLIVNEESVTSGEWSYEVEVVWSNEAKPVAVVVTVVGGGSWTVSFSTAA